MGFKGNQSPQGTMRRSLMSKLPGVFHVVDIMGMLPMRRAGRAGSSSSPGILWAAISAA